MAERLQAIQYIGNSNLPELEKQENIKEIDDAFNELLKVNSEIHFDRLNDAVLYTAPLNYRGFGWRMTPERISSLGLPEGYENKLKFNQATRIWEMMNGLGFDWDEIEDFTGLTFDELKPLFPHVRIIGMIREQEKNSLNNPPEDGSSSRSMRPERRQIVPISGNYTRQGNLHRKLDGLLTPGSSDYRKDDLSDEEISAIKKFSYSQTVRYDYDYDPLSLMTYEELDTLSNLISADRAKSLNVEFDKDFRKLIEQEFDIRDIRNDPFKYRGGGNERKLKREFVSAEEFLGPGMDGYAINRGMHGGWLYPDGRIYPLQQDSHGTEFVYRDAFEDGLIRIIFSQKSQRRDSSMDLEIADARPTPEQYETLQKLMDAGEPSEIRFAAGKKSEEYDASYTSRPTYQYENVLRGKDTKKLKESLTQEVSWKQEESTSDDSSSSLSKKGTYRPLLGHTFEGYGQAEKKLSYSLEKLSKQNGAAKKLNDEEKNVIKKYFQIKNADAEPLRLLSDDEIKTLLNLISEEKLTVRNADLSAELLGVYRKDAEYLLIRELDIRSNPQKYKFGGNERKLKNRFLSAKQLVDPETMGVWETPELRAAWLYPDGRLYHVTDGHTKEHTYNDAFGDGLIRLNVSLAKEKDDRGPATAPFLAIHAADIAPTAEQMKILEELIDVAKPKEIFYQAGVSSKIHNPNEVIPDDSDFGIYVEGERSGTIKSGDLKKRLKQELDAVGWAKLPDNDSSSRSKKDTDIDISDEEFEILDDFANADIDNIEPVEEEPTDIRTRRARARKREEFLRDAVAQIMKLSENAEKFKRGPDAGEVSGGLLERVAKMFAAGDYSIVDKYEKIVKEKGTRQSPGEFFANSYYKYSSSTADAKLQRQKGGNIKKGDFVENIEALEAKITDGEGGFVLPELSIEDDLSVGEIDEDVAKKIAFYDKFEEYLPLHAEIMGYIGSGMPVSKISKQTGVPVKIVNAMKSNMAFIAEQLGDIENWPLDSLDEDYRDVAKLLPGDDMSLNLDIAKRLQKAKTFFETIEFDRDTGEISFDPISVSPRQINLEKNNDIILSFFEEGKPTPLLKDIADALGVTEGSARGLIERLRKKTGRKLDVLFAKKEPTSIAPRKNNLENSIAPRQINLEKNNDIILSFFEEGKPTPLLKDIADALGVTEGSARGLIQRLRKKTGRKLNVLFVKKEPTTTRKLLPASENNFKIQNQKILSLFEDGKVPPSIHDIIDATGLKRAAAYRRLGNLRKTTGRKLILDKPIGDTRKSVIARVKETNKTILSLFKNGKQSPTLEEISKATGLSPGAVSNRLIKLRKSSGQELIVKPKNSKKPKLVVERKPGYTPKEEKKTPDELVLSLFKDSKTPPTMQEIVRELGVSYPAAKERLKRLRQKTGMALSITPVPAMPILNDAINQQLLSLFENNKNITTEQIAKATGLSVSAIKGRLVRLRKETGKELSISRDLPPSLRDDISKTILSFFEEGKSAPTRQQLVDATGFSADGVTRRLQKLRKGTGMDLQLAGTKTPEGRTTMPKLEIIPPKEK
jgi:hypothetical protein